MPSSSNSSGRKEEGKVQERNAAKAGTGMWRWTGN